MKIMIMAGTSDAGKIIQGLSSRGAVDILATATTRHGTDLARTSGADKVLEGRFDSVELAKIIRDGDIEVLIDATHPFASEATRNAIIASETLKVDYIRFERPTINLPDSDLIYKCPSFEEAVGQILQILDQEKNIPGRIFHLAGVNTLHYLTERISPDLIVARVLPSLYSVKKCLELGIPNGNIVAMEGTFSRDFNRILMEEFEIGVVLTKESGPSGGTMSKIQAALDLDIPVVIVTRPEVAELHGKKVFHDVKSLCDEVLSQ